MVDSNGVVGLAGGATGFEGGAMGEGTVFSTTPGIGRKEVERLGLVTDGAGFWTEAIGLATGETGFVPDAVGLATDGTCFATGAAGFVAEGAAGLEVTAMGFPSGFVADAVDLLAEGTAFLTRSAFEECERLGCLREARTFFSVSSSSEAMWVETFTLSQLKSAMSSLEFIPSALANSKTRIEIGSSKSVLPKMVHHPKEVLAPEYSPLLNRKVGFLALLERLVLNLALKSIPSRPRSVFQPSFSQHP